MNRRTFLAVSGGVGLVEPIFRWAPRLQASVEANQGPTNRVARQPALVRSGFTRSSDGTDERAPSPGSGVAGSVTTFTYDTKGELLTIKDPLNNVTTLTYTPVGLIATITDAQSNVTTYAYDAHGNRTSVADALNKVTTFAYDAGDRLTTITYPDTTTKRPSHRVRMSYDPPCGSGGRSARPVYPGGRR